MGQMELSAFRNLCAYVGFGEKELQILKDSLPTLEPVFPKVIDHFYKTAMANPGTQRHIRDAAQLNRLKRLLHLWLYDLFTNPRDVEYLDRRSRVGRIHVEIGLAQIYVFSAMALIRDKLDEAARVRIEDPPRRGAFRRAMHKALDVELATLADSYLEADKFRDLVENAPEMIHSVDPQGRFLDVNRTELQTLGYTLAELRQMTLLDIVPPDQRKAVREHLDHVFDAGLGSIQTQFVTKDGRLLDVEINASGQTDRTTGKVVQTRAYVRDITERKRLQDALQQKERLAAIGSMAVTLAHEVKNPLSGISGAIQILADTPGTDASRSAIYREIQNQIQRLNRLVEDLLQFGRPLVPQREEVQIGSLILRIYAILRDGADLRDVELRLTGDALARPVPLDPSLMQQMFANLFLNAAHAMKGRGTIQVSVDRDGDVLRVRVKDTGPGIPAAIADKLFQPFFTTKPQGSGLGLSICSRIVESHQGRIDAKKDGSPGAEFEIRLPL